MGNVPKGTRKVAVAAASRLKNDCPFFTKLTLARDTSVISREQLINITSHGWDTSQWICPRLSRSYRKLKQVSSQNQIWYSSTGFMGAHFYSSARKR